MKRRAVEDRYGSARPCLGDAVSAQRRDGAICQQQMLSLERAKDHFLLFVAFFFFLERLSTRLALATIFS
jgi:hypothetical protein